MKTISDKKLVFSFNAANPPALVVEPGEEVLFETKDCFSNQIKTADQRMDGLDWTAINPATGPLAVAGAEPGDVLVVRIEDIQVSSQACMVSGPDEGTLGDLLTESVTTIMPIENNSLLFADKVRLPIRPMIGVIGVAPAHDDIATGSPGHHGGNMDTNRITAGTTLYLPVAVAGGLLAMGDLHAVMGDGEVSVCGAEIPGKVTVKVDLLKHVPLEWPMLEIETDWYVIASGKTLDEAAYLATRAAAEMVSTQMGLTLNEAVSLLSLAGNLEISQVVDPLKTVRMRMPKSVFAVKV
jgi:amidase